MKRLIFYFSTLIILIPCISKAQDYATMMHFAQIQDSSLTNSNVLQLIANGRVFENTYHRDLGHPFFLENEFFEGDLVYSNTKYTKLTIKYNIFDQELLLKPIVNKLNIEIILPIEKVDEFTISSYDFKKYSLVENVPAYYQLVVETNDMICLYHWRKSREASNHIPGFASYEFREKKVKKYLVYKGLVNTFQNNRSFVKILPLEIQESVLGYLKTNKIKVKSISDTNMTDLLHFCQSTLEQSNNQ